MLDRKKLDCGISRKGSFVEIELGGISIVEISVIGKFFRDERLKTWNVNCI